MDTRLEDGNEAREVAAILHRAASAGIDPRRVVVALGLPLSTLADFEATLRADSVNAPISSATHKRVALDALPRQPAVAVEQLRQEPLVP